MNAADPRALRVHEAEKLNLVFRKSTIRHPDSGIGVFAGEPIPKGQVVGYYYGALVYGDIGCSPRMHKTYGSGILAVTSHDFAKWALRVINKFFDTHDTPYEG